MPLSTNQATQYTVLVPVSCALYFACIIKTNSKQVMHLKNVRLLISFEKDFTNNFITTLLGIFPHEIGKKRAFFTWGLGPIFGKSLHIHTGIDGDK
jgi:hypothetical protein